MTNLQDTHAELKFLSSWLLPCAEEGPCGEDVGFTPEFEAIKEEVEKSFSLHQNRQTDWEDVLVQANKLLAKQTKDLWVLCYGVRAVYELHGLSGLIDSVAVLNEVLQKFWDDLHPGLQRLQRRAAPLNWLCNRLEMLIPASNFPEDEGQTAEALKNLLTAMKAFLDEKLGDKGPSFGNIFKAIPVSSVKDSEVVPQVSGETPLTFATPAQHGAQPAVLPKMAPGSASTEGLIANTMLPQVFRGIQDQVQRLALHFLQQDMTDWRVYLLHRSALWCTIVQLPQANNDGLTQLRPVPRDKVLTYSAAVDAKRFGEILPQLERSAAKMPFWFDGHHMVAKCLEGIKADEALHFLKITLKYFLDRFPDLILYKYNDGTPFASPKTIHWLESLSNLPAVGGDGFSGQGGLGHLGSGAADEEQILKEALEISQEKGFSAGLQKLERVQPSKSRASIGHGLLVARFCLAAGRPAAAAGLLHEIYNNLESWGLLDWEPELSARVLALLISASGGQRLELPEEMSRRLYWLNLDTALATFKEIK